MTLEQLREKGWIIFEAIAGSHAYGTNVEGSDIDIRGIYIQPTSTMLGLTTYVPQVSDETNDITFYEIGRFLELAQKGNPNLLELLNMPKEQIVFQSLVFSNIFTQEFVQKFITTRLEHSFTGFAYAQIKKARGYNKKVAWEKGRTEKKGPLDFSYVITNREESVKFKHWVNKMSHEVLKTKLGFLAAGNIEQEDICLAKVNNVPDLYSMYLYKNKGGITNSSSNGIQTKSLPKGSPFIGYFRFDNNAYSTHCKDYASYQQWLKERNKERFENNQSHGKGFDSKNLMHTFRLLNMALDLAEGRGIVVRRPEFKELLNIRSGNVEYDDLLKQADSNVLKIKEAFRNADLPREVSIKLVNKTLTDIRLNHM